MTRPRQEPTKLQQITVALLCDRYGGTERFWERYRRRLVKAGLINKIGLSFFGDLTAIDEAVASGGPEVWEA